LFTFSYGQKNSTYQLIIKSVLESENSYLSSLKYKKEFRTEKNLKKTKDSVLTILKENGFYTTTQDSLTKNKNQFTYFISLGEKISFAVLKINPRDRPLLESLNIKTKKNYVSLRIGDLKKTITLIMDELVNTGQSFSKVNLSNVSILNTELTAALHISRSTKRTIDKMIIKGYSDFPESFLKHHFNIKIHSTVNSKLLTEISHKTNQLGFADEIKSPEILFSNDSTIIYLYLKKKKSNYFDGLANFNSENKKIKFRGYFNLHLTNTFNHGEEININWNNNGNNKQEFNLKSSLPYIFNTKLHFQANFNLYRNDSTFTNTNVSLQSTHSLSTYSKLGLLYRSTTSTNLIELTNVTIQDFDKKEIGILFNYKNKYEFNFQTTFGTRTHNNERTNQLQIEFNASTTYKTSATTALYLKNTTGILSSPNYFYNELYRIGGTNSIRGFDQQSIFASKYSYLNTEFRLFTKDSSYLYTIGDFGTYTNNAQNTTIFGIGIGYSISRKYTRTNISYSMGKSSNTKLNLNDAKLSIKTLILF